VCNEHPLSGIWFSEGFSKYIPESELVGHPGYSAGKFAIVGKSLRDRLFTYINQYCDYSTKYVAVEQPFFNMAIYLTNDETISVDDTLLTEYVSFNGTGYDKKKTIFLDHAGDCASDSSHSKKILNSLSLFLAGVL
jgi:hypothetical protein